MDLSDPSPPVNAALMRRYVGRKVRTVLQVTAVEGGVVKGKSPDGIEVSVRVRQGSSFPSSSAFVEVVGVVEGEGVLREEHSTAFGASFDMASFNQLCQLANAEHQSLFIG